MLTFRVVIFLIAAAVTLEVVSATNYCAICPARSHTMCKYRSYSQKNCGTQTYNFEVKQPDQEIILAKHNELRSRIAGGQETQGSNGGQPSASNMCRLQWDQELADIAQRWMYQCTFAHDECRNVDRWSVGQNAAIEMFPEVLFPTTSIAANWSGVVQGWYNEVNLFDQNRIPNFINYDKTGHYTQVAWGETCFVGCGYIYFKAPYPLDPRFPYEKIYACNYGPAGNIKGGTMYKVGQPCGDCPGSCSENLCSK